MPSSVLKIAQSTVALAKNKQSKIALLIDADNAPAQKIELILAEIANYGVANIRRAYGNWINPNLGHWKKCLHEHAIQPVQQFDYTKGKNATDAALIIDAMDLLYTQNLDAFAIVSSDCDFTPLVMRILTNGLKAYGFGGIQTPAPFVQACSSFSYLENISQTSLPEIAKSTASGTKKTGKQLKQDTKLIIFLRNAIAETQEADQWSRLSAILIGLFEAIDLFEINRRPEGIYVREKK